MDLKDRSAGLFCVVRIQMTTVVTNRILVNVCECGIERIWQFLAWISPEELNLILYKILLNNEVTTAS